MTKEKVAPPDVGRDWKIQMRGMFFSQSDGRYPPNQLAKILTAIQSLRLKKNEERRWSVPL